MNSSIYNKLLNEYQNFIKTLIFYNEYYGGVFNNLGENRIDEKAIDTYINICNYEMENIDEKLIFQLSDKIKKVVYLFNREEEVEFIYQKIDFITKKYNKIKFYDIFCIFADILKLLEENGNYLIKFIKCIINFNFEQYVNVEPIIMESILFVQRLLILFEKVFNLHWKKTKIIRRIMIY